MARRSGCTTHRRERCGDSPAMATLMSAAGGPRKAATAGPGVGGMGAPRSAGIWRTWVRTGLPGSTAMRFAAKHWYSPATPLEGPFRRLSWSRSQRVSMQTPLRSATASDPNRAPNSLIAMRHKVEVDPHPVPAAGPREVVRPVGPRERAAPHPEAATLQVEATPVRAATPAPEPVAMEAAAGAGATAAAAVEAVPAAPAVAVTRLAAGMAAPAAVGATPV